MSNLKPFVRYNVEGRVFQISHELVQRHPTTKLAIMAKQQQQQQQQWNNSDGIFLDGNSDRFSYVLDYVRTGQVMLPATISKAALLQDLHFYGFEHIPPDAVISYSASGEGSTTVKEATTTNVSADHYYEEALKTIDDEIAQLHYKRSCVVVAHECFQHYKRDGITSGGMVLDNSSLKGNVNRCFSNLNEDVLNEQLALYDLYLRLHQPSINGMKEVYKVHLWVGKISEQHLIKVVNRYIY